MYLLVNWIFGNSYIGIYCIHIGVQKRKLLPTDPASAVPHAPYSARAGAAFA